MLLLHVREQFKKRYDAAYSMHDAHENYGNLKNEKVSYS